MWLPTWPRRRKLSRLFCSSSFSKLLTTSPSWAFHSTRTTNGATSSNSDQRQVQSSPSSHEVMSPLEHQSAPCLVGLVGTVAGRYFCLARVFFCRVFSKRSCLSCGVRCRGNVVLHMSQIVLRLLAQEHAEVEVADVSVRVDDLPLRTVVEVVIRPLILGFSRWRSFICSLFPKHSTESTKTTTMLLRCLSASVEPRFARLVTSSSRRRIQYLIPDEMCHLICFSCRFLPEGQDWRHRWATQMTQDTVWQMCSTTVRSFKMDPEANS